MKLKQLILGILLIFLFSQKVVLAESSYVLPYPGIMPGGIPYKIHLAYEFFLKYWYFGDFGQFEYNLKESDKYLVEAKTLFEYKQYLLGLKAEQKSDFFFEHTLPYLNQAERDGKNIQDKRFILSQAALKHIEVLKRLNVPATFNWSPERKTPAFLNLKQALINSINIRKKYL